MATAAWALGPKTKKGRPATERPIQNIFSNNRFKNTPEAGQAQLIAQRCRISMPYARLVLSILQEGRRDD